MKSYTVKSGDTLSKIAKKFGQTLSAVLIVNPQIHDPSKINVGQIISIPEAADVTPTTALPKPAPPPPTPDATAGTEVKELIKRARTALGRKVKYELGAGGMVATSGSPANIKNACDCSGFVSWCYGRSRKTDHPLYLKFNGGWINTDAMVNDARRESGFFRHLSGPRVGCIVVFPGPPLRKIGHVGIVTEVNAAGTAVTKVIHCSAGNGRKGDAIQETSAAVFNQASAVRRVMW
jgi:LysM repeat protein